MHDILLLTAIGAGATLVMDAWLLGPDGQLKPEYRPPVPVTEEASVQR